MKESAIAIAAAIVVAATNPLKQRLGWEGTKALALAYALSLFFAVVIAVFGGGLQPIVMGEPPDLASAILQNAFAISSIATAIYRVAREGILVKAEG
jgi:hypothetical protein